MTLTETGMAMLVKDTHAKKVELEMLVNDPGIVTFFKDLHSLQHI